jgi:ABC-type glycerol-3-phosphate transport system substrate-binding protein
MDKQAVSRRSMLKGMAAIGAGSVLAACAPKTPEPVAPTAKPAEPTAAPQEPTAAPVEPTAAPVEPTEKPKLTVPEGAADNHDIFVPLLSTEEPVTLSRWDSCQSESISKHYDELNIKFTEFYPNVTMDLQHAQSPENFVAACAAGTPPDVWSGGWNPERIGIWAYTGCLLPIDDYLDAVDFPRDRFIPGCWGTVEMDGKTWGIPSGVGMYMMWVNAAHLEEVGADFPKDTDELWQIADELTTRDANGDIQRLGMRLTTWFWEHMTWISSFGGRIWDDEKNEPSPDHPGVLAALNDMVDAVNRYGVETLDRWSASIGGQSGVAQPFFAGLLSMMIDGDWYLQQIDEMKPEWKPGQDYFVEAAPFAPASKLGGDPAVSLWVWPQLISKGAKEPDYAFEFLRWVCSRERAVTGAMSTRDLISTVAYLKDPRVDWESAKVVIRFLESGKKGISPLPCTPISGEYSDLIGAAVDEIIHLKITPEEAMARVKDEAMALYEEFRA